jgi:hypothetical protein
VSTLKFAKLSKSVASVFTDPDKFVDPHNWALEYNSIDYELKKYAMTIECCDQAVLSGKWYILQRSGSKANPFRVLMKHKWLPYDTYHHDRFGAVDPCPFAQKLATASFRRWYNASLCSIR